MEVFAVVRDIASYDGKILVGIYSRKKRLTMLWTKTSQKQLFGFLLTRITMGLF